MAEDDVVIELDAPEDTAVVKTEPEAKEHPPKVEAKKETPEADEGIETLKAQLETLTAGQQAERERADREAAEAARQRAETEKVRSELSKVRTEAQDTQVAAMDSAIAAAEAEATAAENEHRAALEVGDFAKAAQAQRKIARAEAKLVNYQGAKADLETRKAEPEPEPEQRQTQTPASDPFERAIAGATPRTQAWLRNHREFVTDPKLNMKANAAHNMAVADGYIPDSDAYFDFCEQFLGLKQEPAAEAEPPAKPRTTRKPAMPAAPVSRDASSSPANGNLSSGQIALTPGEQRAAQDGTVVWNYDDPAGKYKKGNPIGLKEYAKRKAAMQSEGRYGSNYTEQ